MSASNKSFPLDGGRVGMGVSRRFSVSEACRLAALIDHGRIAPTQPSPIKGEG
jgi:hypothetical protein